MPLPSRSYAWFLPASLIWMGMGCGNSTPQTSVDGVALGDGGTGTGGTGGAVSAGGAPAGGSAALGGQTSGGSAFSTGGGGLAGSGASGGAPMTGAGGANQADPCGAYEWPAYDPALDWKLPGSDVDPGTLQIYQGCDAQLVAGTKASGWWSITWGHDRNPSITDAHIDQVLSGLNEDMGYIRDIMGWPPDPMPQDGYYSSVYLYGSGLCTDNAPNTEQGGWQSAIGPYPMVLLSWAPIVNYDRGGITHEAIHAMVQGMPGGKNKAHWFNEGGNTWIQMQLGAVRDGSYGVGFLDGTPFVAPHQPIESYSGWLLDGSFGGPNAEGVGDCNWRKYLGGTQYNAIFPHFLAQHVSPGAVAWLWAQPTPRNILETLATGLGEKQTRHLVTEFRARSALVDFGLWRESIIEDGINSAFGQTLNRECGSGDNPPDYLATPYAPTTMVGSQIVPDPYTLPGWSGANQIPLQVSGNQMRLQFSPVGQNMTLQLAYWAEDGSAVYSRPVDNGELCLNLSKPPKGGVVIAVVTNTDYVYVNDETRRAKHDYRIDLVQGATATADRETKWFLNE